MALVPSQVLRVAILLSYCSILCNYKAIEMPSHHTYGGSWKFLTFIDLVTWSLGLAWRWGAARWWAIRRGTQTCF
ncbi:androgen-induced gene 1 protein isoform X7 [Myotis yumanensis]|uniref:androgen-induced gene 1 protein isoform X7 n=1 Tax=Myotis yumanensis TaxID=159337 RepID=UPI0038CF841C